VPPFLATPQGYSHLKGTERLAVTFRHPTTLFPVRETFISGVGQVSPDGTRIVTVPADGRARIVDAASGQIVKLLVGHSKSVKSASFSPDGKHIVTTSEDTTARVWDAESAQTILTLHGGEELFAATFSHDGKRIVTAGEDRTARVWRADTEQLLTVLKGHERAVASA